MRHFLDFEKPLAELEGKIDELRHLSNGNDINIADEVTRLEAKVDRLLRQTYAKLTAWQKVQLARHPDRPHGSDYIKQLVTDFTPLAGDRAFGEDRAIIGGLGRFRGHSVVVLAHEKGADTESRLRHNFGMARPEGYRKARRLMDLADRFGLPVLTFIDTAGAYPGIDAEARGQAEAIARSIETSLQLRVPLVASIIGEGGSGGALALAAGNRVLMLEHSTYSVISPEACASIIWRTSDNTQDAAEALKLTAQDLLKLGVIDTIVPEPLGGAHREREPAMAALGDAIETVLRPPLAARRSPPDLLGRFRLSREARHDAAGTRPRHRSSRPPHAARHSAQGRRGRRAHPPRPGGSAGCALLPGADGADPGYGATQRREPHRRTRAPTRPGESGARAAAATARELPRRRRPRQRACLRRLDALDARRRAGGGVEPAGRRARGRCAGDHARRRLRLPAPSRGHRRGHRRRRAAVPGHPVAVRPALRRRLSRGHADAARHQRNRQQLLWRPGRAEPDASRCRPRSAARRCRRPGHGRRRFRR